MVAPLTAHALTIILQTGHSAEYGIMADQIAIQGKWTAYQTEPDVFRTGILLIGSMMMGWLFIRYLADVYVGNEL